MCTFPWLVSFISSCYIIELGFRCRLANCFPNIYYLFCVNNYSLGFKSFPLHLHSKHPSVVNHCYILFINDFRRTHTHTHTHAHTQRRNAMDANEQMFHTSRCDSLISEFTLKGKSLMFSLLWDNNSVRIRFDQIMIRWAVGGFRLTVKLLLLGIWFSTFNF